jgi:hypothetical protein
MTGRDRPARAGLDRLAQPHFDRLAQPNLAPLAQPNLEPLTQPDLDRLAWGGLDRLARAGLAAAARRWPADLSEIMAREWAAELEAIRNDPGLGRLARARRTIAFAGSITLSPAVEEDGAEPITWANRAASLTRPAAVAAGLTLLAAALFDAVHLVYRHSRVSPAAAIGVLAVAALVMVALAVRSRAGGPAADAVQRRARATATVGDAIRTTALLGGAMFAFLLAGNQVAVMPFMGWIDILPAVATWTVVTAAGAATAAHLVAAGRRGLGTLAGVAGGLVGLDLAAVAGSLHAAEALGLGLGSAPVWLPLALLPGGTASFGAYFADGTAAFGSLQASGPAFHASGILIGNAAAMVGPLLLCSVYVVTRATAPGRTSQDRGAVRARWHRLPSAIRDLGVARVLVGAGGGLLALAAGEGLRRASGSVDATLHRMLDNSNVFGFGFLAHAPGRIAVALLVGLLIAHRSATDRPSEIAQRRDLDKQGDATPRNDAERHCDAAPRNDAARQGGIAHRTEPAGHRTNR